MWHHPSSAASHVSQCQGTKVMNVTVNRKMGATKMNVYAYVATGTNQYKSSKGGSGAGWANKSLELDKSCFELIM